METQDKINKNEIAYILRFLVVNAVPLLIFLLFFLAGGYKIPFHLAILLLCPFIFYIIINVFTKSKTYILSYRVRGKSVNIIYFSFFKKYELDIPIENISFEKIRRNTRSERYILKIHIKDESTFLKQYDDFGWSEKDFDQIMLMTQTKEF